MEGAERIIMIKREDIDENVLISLNKRNENWQIVEDIKNDLNTQKEDYANYLASELQEALVIRELPNGVKDETIIVNGKAEYIKRVSDEVAISGNENVIGGEDLGSVYRASIPKLTIPNLALTPSGQSKNASLFMGSNIRHLVSWNSDTEHFYLDGNSLVLFINKMKIDNVQGMTVVEKIKNYIKDEQPVTLTYQLAEPTITELVLDDLSPNTQQIVKLTSQVDKLTSAIITMGGTIV